jgi:drug/metabolite transporter (DMT)-like permease
MKSYLICKPLSTEGFSPSNHREFRYDDPVTGAALALVVAAAGFHAIWNALAKRAQDQLVFLWSSVSLATVMLLPVGLAWLPPGGVPAAAVPFVVATIVIHAVYFFALGRAYRHGDFSRVYPIARGLGVALVPLVALILFDERLSPLGTLGVALVVAGIASLQLVSGAWRGARSRASGAGTAWALLTGLTIAVYSLVDKAGVARLHPVPYIGLMGVGISALLAPVVLAERQALAREWRVNWRTILVASSMNLTSYLLVLFAFRLSKVGYVVAARELSILFSAFIGSLWLGEGRLGPRLVGASIVLAGVVCVAFAR